MRGYLASVAQLAEQLTLNQRVLGSSPSGGIDARPCTQSQGRVVFSINTGIFNNSHPILLP